MTQDLDSFLAHHGVKGMRWGHRKAEDSGGSDSSAAAPPAKQAKRDAKAKKYDARADVAQARIDTLMQKPYRNVYTEYSKKKEIADLSKERDIARSDADKKRAGKLSSGQKKAVIGASIVAGLLVAGGTYTAIQNGEANRALLKGKALIEGRSTPWKPNPSLAKKDMDVADLHKLVAGGCNPGYGATGTKVNCRRSTFAYEMRRRGYDVAATRTTTGTGQTTIGLVTATTPGAKRSVSKTRHFSALAKDKFKSDTDTNYDRSPFLRTLVETSTVGKSKIAENIGTRIVVDSKGSASVKKAVGHDATSIFGALAKQPNGARGELGMVWTGGGGHSMAWEIVKGKPVIFDTQSHETYATPAMFDKMAKAIKEVGYTRLDNADLNEDFLMRWLKDA